MDSEKNNITTSKVKAKTVIEMFITTPAAVEFSAWAPLRRRPPPAGAAFGRKVAGHIVLYLPPLLL